MFHHAGDKHRVAGSDPVYSDYASFASFSDPDGNGRVDAGGENARPRAVSR